jgi:hypothetical protein
MENEEKNPFAEAAENYKAATEIMNQLRLPYLIIAPIPEGVMTLSNMDMDYQDLMIFRAMMTRTATLKHFNARDINLPQEGKPQ